MLKRFFSEVEAADVITLFRHIAADSDALGAQFGVKAWIEATWPDKKVYALGEDLGSHATHFPPIDQVNDEIVKGSLAIVLDTANTARIDDERWKLASFVIKVDHHIAVEDFGDLQIVDETAGATCEILANMFHELKVTLNRDSAAYLYSGLIADTLQFSIASTTSKTLYAAAYLARFGIDIPSINAMNFDKSRKEFDYESYLRSHMQVIDEHIAYAIVSREEYEQFGLTLNEAKEKVYAFSHVNEFEIWALFTYHHEDDNHEPIYNGSLRSRHTAINDIANRYHGGGHKLACGVKNLTRSDIASLLHELSQRIA